MARFRLLTALAVVGTLNGCSSDPQPSAEESAPEQQVGNQATELELTPEDHHRQSLQIAEQYLSERDGSRIVEKSEVIDGVIHVHVNRSVLGKPESAEIIATLFYVYERERTSGPIESLVHLHFADTGEPAGEHTVDTASLTY